VLDVGQAADIYRGGVTYVQVKRLVAGLDAVTAERQEPPVARVHGERPGPAERAAHAGALALVDRQAAGQLPDIAPVLDAAFGPEPGR